MTCPNNPHHSDNNHVPAQLPASEEVSTYPSRIRLADVDWATIVASNQEDERVDEQLRIGLYCFTMKHDMLACSGIAAVSNLQDPKECAPPQQPTYKPRHF